MDEKDKAPLRIVCAAQRRNGMIVVGARHKDNLMRQQVLRAFPIRAFFKCRSIWCGWEQGFVDQFCDFHTRTEAWKIAEKAEQIWQRCGGDTADGGTLYSENLY